MVIRHLTATSLIAIYLAMSVGGDVFHQLQHMVADGVFSGILLGILCPRMKKRRISVPIPMQSTYQILVPKTNIFREWVLL